MMEALESTKSIKNFVSLKQASKWASKFLNREVSESNISYLINYGKVRKYPENGSIFINLDELKSYYESYQGKREIKWKDTLGKDLNWHLSFDHLREKDTTKHVHRLHPYKGKFIPQLVEYFLDQHTDEFKKEVYFQPGDIVLDPFVGSGTTLIQANELGIHSIGIDISYFNGLISKVKLSNHNLQSLTKETITLKTKVNNFEQLNNINKFEKELSEALLDFNRKYFPSPQIKLKFNSKELDEKKYSSEKERDFLDIYKDLIKKYGIQLKQNEEDSFLDKWYSRNVRNEMAFAGSVIKSIKDPDARQVLAIILSRTIRSCRATTHSDLATLKEPQLTTYYCHKHKKICKPIFSIKNMFSRYAYDTLQRLDEFQKLKKDSEFQIIISDSRKTNIAEKLQNGSLLKKAYQHQKIKGIFTSPPYVGQIDYHDQHAYAYDLFNLPRNDSLEIGPLYKGQGLAARNSYTEGIAGVLINSKKYLSNDAHIFIVANDKYNLYPTIAEKASMKIIEKFKRPVLNRTERDKSPYSEIIFHLIA